MRRLIYDMYYADEISVEIAERLLDKLEESRNKRMTDKIGKTIKYIDEWKTKGWTESADSLFQEDLTKFGKIIL